MSARDQLALLPISDRLAWLRNDHPLYQCAALAYFRPDPELLVALLAGWPEKSGKRIAAYRNHVMSTLSTAGATDEQIGAEWGIGASAVRGRLARNITRSRNPADGFDAVVRIEVVPPVEHGDDALFEEPLDPRSLEVALAAMDLAPVWAGVPDDELAADREHAAAVIEELERAGTVQVLGHGPARLEPDQ